MVALNGFDSVAYTTIVAADVRKIKRFIYIRNTEERVQHLLCEMPAPICIKPVVNYPPVFTYLTLKNTYTSLHFCIILVKMNARAI